MFQSPREMRAFVHDLVSSTWTLGAIGFLYESGLASELTEPRSLEQLARRFARFPRERIERCLRLALSAGFVAEQEPDGYRLTETAAQLAQPPFEASFRGDLRGHLMQCLAYLDSARQPSAGRGWRHTDPLLLDAQGESSSGFAQAFQAQIVGQLGDLGTRLEQPGARWLDVGVGVGALAVALCRAFPALSVVGLDVFEVPLARARERVARAGLTSRIQLEQCAVQDYQVESAFDVVWLPTFFIYPELLQQATVRVHAALRPGGWVLFPLGTSTGSERQQGMLALVTELWGGPALSPPEGEALLRAGGFSSVRTLPGPPWAPITLAAQR